MELTYDEKLQLENSKEHLQTVLVNIRMATEELSKVLKRKEEVELEIEVIEIITDKIKETNLEEYKKRSSYERTNFELKQLNNSLIKERDSIILSISTLQKELFNATASFNNTKLINEKYINAQEEKIDSLLKEVKSLEDTISNHENTAKEKYVIRKSIEDEVLRLSNEKEKIEKVLTRFKKDSQEEMENISKLIETEKDKIRNPLKLLGEETDKLNRKIKDLAIIKSRLIKQFKAQNPEHPLPRELKQEENE